MNKSALTDAVPYRTELQQNVSGLCLQQASLTISAIMALTTVDPR